MKKYIIKTDKGTFESSSRNTKNHIQETGAEYAIAYTKTGKIISSARRWGDGTITNVFVVE